MSQYVVQLRSLCWAVGYILEIIRIKNGMVGIDYSVIYDASLERMCLYNTNECVVNFVLAKKVQMV